MITLKNIFNLLLSLSDNTNHSLLMLSSVSWVKSVSLDVSFFYLQRRVSFLDSMRPSPSSLVSLRTFHLIQ